MFRLIIWWLCYFVLARGDLRQVDMPVFSPPTQEEILNTYFRSSEEVDANRTKKSIFNVPDNLKETMDIVKKELSMNISNLEKEMNFTESETEGNFSEPTQDYFRAGVFRNYISESLEPTTYRYPTAVWSSQNYEKLKSGQRFRPRNSSRIFGSRPTINPAYVYLDRGFSFATPEKAQRRNRGKTKWKDSSRHFELSDQTLKLDKTEFVDRFLEQSLSKYLISSNLRENVGNVSVKTFSELLKNVTEQKPRRLQSPYDENKELRMKFREEVILKKKNETRPHGKFLEKQLQRRLEKVQDVFNEKDKDKILANMWKYTPLNRTTDFPEEKRNKTVYETEENVTTTVTASPASEFTTTKLYNASLVYITTENPQVEYSHSTQTFRGNVKYHWSRYDTTESSKWSEATEKRREGGASKNLLKLTAEETSYYRRGQFPSLTFIGQPEKPGVIPGRPLIDYPVHSFPPVTKFRCPKFKDEKPKMMADPETRCQVFYICTGDGPTTPMLCPNGTMFNENFLVCDWWYNVNC